MTVRQLEEYIRTTYGPDALDYEINVVHCYEDDRGYEDLESDEIEIDSTSKQIFLG